MSNQPRPSLWLSIEGKSENRQRQIRHYTSTIKQLCIVSSLYKKLSFIKNFYYCDGTIKPPSQVSNLYLWAQYTHVKTLTLHLNYSLYSVLQSQYMCQYFTLINIINISLRGRCRFRIFCKDAADLLLLSLYRCAAPFSLKH